MLFASCFQEDLPEVVERVKVGDNLPSMQLTLNDGRTLSNADLQGRTVVLVFFSTLCDDCRRELPEVEALWQKVREDESIVLVAISRGEGSDKVAPFWQEMQLSMPYSAQPDRRIYELFANSIVPRIYVASPTGKVVASFDHNNMPSAQTLWDIIRPN